MKTEYLLIIVMAMILKDAINQYLEWKATHTMKAAVPYRLHLERFADIVHKENTEGIVLDDITKFYQLMKMRFAPANVAYSMTIVRNFMRYCHAQRCSNIEPFLIRIPKFTSKIRAVVEQKDINAMSRVCDVQEFTGLEKLVVIRMLWETGMRVSELCDMELSNIETDKTYTSIITKKNRQMRWVMWSPTTHRLLLRYIGVRICLNQRQALFIALRGRKKLTTRTIQRWVTDLKCEAGITKPITPHSFRHGKAHAMIQSGANVKEVQMILGHSEDNPRAAFQYMRLDKTEALNIAKKFVDNYEGVG